jgi:hypothetical protein
MRTSRVNTGLRHVGRPAKYNTFGEYAGRVTPCSRVINHPAPAGSLTRELSMHARLVWSVLGLLALGACNGPSPEQTADYSPPAPTSAESQAIADEVAEAAPAETAKPARLGKRHLSSYTINMTKAQVREFLGSPAEVGSEDPTGRVSWFYWNLPVYDEEAGTQAKVVRFTFENDRVVEVGY